MSSLGPVWFFWSLAAFFGVVAGYLMYRFAVREALPRDHHDFVAFPVRATNLVFQLIVEPVRASRRVSKVAVTRQRGDEAPSPSGQQGAEPGLASEIGEGDGDIGGKAAIDANNW